jgi:hypothetical protein
MGPLNDFYCWEIMQCDKSKNCAAKENPSKSCWEIAKEKNDDYRNHFNICRDCIVKVLKTDNSVLSHLEIRTIVAAKTNCDFLCHQAGLPSPDQNVMPLPPG